MTKPRLSVARIHRASARSRGPGLAAPSYASVHAIVRALDPALVTLAQKGPPRSGIAIELVHRHRAERPNAIWQADHTLLDIVILDDGGKPARPWLTTVIDDYSRAVAGYMVFLGAPSALNTSLALRQAIWRKPPGLAGLRHPRRALCRSRQRLHQPPSRSGRRRPALPARLLGRGAAAGPRQDRAPVRHHQHRTPARAARAPAGGKPATPPRCRLPSWTRRSAPSSSTSTMRGHPQRDRRDAARRMARPTAGCPACPKAWRTLDMLLVMVAKPRCVHRDGIHFQGLRYIDPTLAAMSARPSRSATIRATWARSGSSTATLPVPCGQPGTRRRSRHPQGYPGRAARPPPLAAQRRSTSASHGSSDSLPAQRSLPGRRRQRPAATPRVGPAANLSRRTDHDGRTAGSARTLSSPRSIAASPSSPTPCASTATSASVTARPASARRSPPAATPTGTSPNLCSSTWGPRRASTQGVRSARPAPHRVLHADRRRTLRELHGDDRPHLISRVDICIDEHLPPRHARSDAAPMPDQVELADRRRGRAAVQDRARIPP